MSQYPSPPSYSPSPQQQPGYGYDFSYYQPQQNPLAPARRASVMMFVIGGLLAIGGLCCGGIAAIVPMDEIMAQQPALQTMPGLTADLLKTGMIVMGVLGLLFGMVLLVLGYFVRSGHMVPVVISIVLVTLAVLFNALNLASSAFQLRGAGPELIGAVCVNVIPLVMMVTLLAWLVQAAKAAPRIAMMKSQYQQQLWQYQQQQQMYQAGYLAPPPPQSPPPAYPQPTPPVPPAPPPPPSSPDDPSRGDPYGPA